MCPGFSGHVRNLDPCPEKCPELGHLSGKTRWELKREVLWSELLESSLTNSKFPLSEERAHKFKIPALRSAS